MAGQSASFGKRKEPHTLIIAHGDRVRHFTIRPWLAGFLGSAIIAVSLGYLGATSYLVLRDTVFSASAARQTRIQQAYEERILSLRAQLDRITSRQLLDQQLMETKVAEIIERQSHLTDRQGRLEPILNRAGLEMGAQLPVAPPLPTRRQETMPEITGSIQFLEKPIIAATADMSPFANWTTRNGNDHETATIATAQAPAETLLATIDQSLKTIESRQLAQISRLTDVALQNTDAISEALETAGLPVDADAGPTGSDMGGPLIPLNAATLFDDRLQDLDEALQKLSRIKQEARRLPLAHPAPGQKVTSLFGTRHDPLAGTPAFHSGMDFRASIGMDAKATAPGIVVSAGWNGGYGRMVEIDHGHSLTTRYAHLSRITVSVGQKVEAGEIIGRTGNSGRSTGPHLHYEVLHNGQALNPSRFLKAGKAVQQYL